MKRLSLTDLSPVTADFSKWLKGWKKTSRDNFVRVEGAVAQGLWLDRLRTGGYRPTFYLHILSLPGPKGGMDMIQFLDMKFQDIQLETHSNLFDRLTIEATASIHPKINEKLDVLSCYKTIAETAAPTPRQAAVLASLALYLNDEEAFRAGRDMFSTLLKDRFSSREDQLEPLGDFLSTLDCSADPSGLLHEMIETNIAKNNYA